MIKSSHSQPCACCFSSILTNILGRCIPDTKVPDCGWRGFFVDKFKSGKFVLLLFSDGGAIGGGVIGKQLPI